MRAVRLVQHRQQMRGVHYRRLGRPTHVGSDPLYEVEHSSHLMDESVEEVLYREKTASGGRICQGSDEGMVAVKVGEERVSKPLTAAGSALSYRTEPSKQTQRRGAVSAQMSWTIEPWNVSVAETDRSMNARRRRVTVACWAKVATIDARATVERWATAMDSVGQY